MTKDTPSSNGDKALINQLELRIEELKDSEVPGRRSDVLILQGQIDILKRVASIERLARRAAKYPSILYLILKRPGEAIPYLIAIFLGVSSLYISEIREAALTSWGIPQEAIMILAEGRGTAAILILVVVGIMQGAKYRE